MSDLKDATAAELARNLEIMADFPHNTGGLSMLDEATMAFGRDNPHVASLQRAFAEARHAHMRSYSSATCSYSDKAWRTAIDAARSLAAALRELGDVRIARCKRPSGWGICNLPLDSDGECRSTFGHTDGGSARS